MTETTTPLRAFSSGGGTQSIAALVLSAQGVIDYPLHIFSNVGDDSEEPATIAYVHNVAIPYAEKHGIEYHVVKRVMRDGTERTLLQDLERDSRTINIPIRMENGAPGNRNCTATYKLLVIAREMKRRGATADNPATVGVGITLDEIQRADGGKNRKPWERITYPLIGIGEETGLKLRRDDCVRIIREAGLPQPGKSACWFCPMKKPSQWADQRRNEPELFAKACALEAQLIERRHKIGKDAAYFTRFAKPLAEAIDTDQTLFADDTWMDAECDSGVCFT